MSIEQYVNNSIKMVEGLLKGEYRQLRKFKLYGKQALKNGYHPELDHSNELITEITFIICSLLG